jgi:error-prone DNA polymerase
VYAELHCLTHFSFQRGASSPRELIERAKLLGYRALAITDECSFAGIVRAWEVAKELGVPMIVGSEFQLADGPKVVLLAPDKLAYEQLCRLITVARRRSEKGEYRIGLADIESNTDRLLALWIPRWPAQGFDAEALEREARALRDRFDARLWFAWERVLHPQERERHGQLRALGLHLGCRLVAAGDVHMHERSRKALQDVLACVRGHTHIGDPAAPIFPNGERHLRTPAALKKLYPQLLLDETLAIAERCSFRLDELKYTYPSELVPEGATPAQHLRRLTEDGMQRRYPGGCPDSVVATVQRELDLIADLRYEHYFLTVEEIVSFARSRKILCQGRGSAANSAVCYMLGITEVDPARMNLLFERFISKERAEPPDIRRRLRAPATRGSDPASVRQVRTRSGCADLHGPELSDEERHPGCRQGARSVTGSGERADPIDDVLGQRRPPR